MLCGSCIIVLHMLIPFWDGRQQNMRYPRVEPRCKQELINERMNGWIMDGWMDDWMIEWMS